MKDLSFFLLKNSLGAKMRKGYSNFCNNDSSTSTLNQRKGEFLAGNSSCMDNSVTAGEKTPPTLEEMILQLEFEEKMAREAKQRDEYGEIRRRMSSVNNSDILRSARNALNQYPRFSLDGKDAMYRSSFRNMPHVVGLESRKGLCKGGFVNSQSEKKAPPCLPKVVAGVSVVWCKPGVVAELMGLDAMPIPVHRNCRREKLGSATKRQNLRMRAEKHEMMERRKVATGVNGRGEMKRGVVMGSCSSTGYCVMKPVKVEPANDGGGWPTRRFG